MAKLADALASGASGRKVVQVQVLFRARNQKATPIFGVAFLFRVSTEQYLPVVPAPTYSVGVPGTRIE